MTPGNKKKGSAINTLLETKSSVLWGILILVTLVFTLVFCPEKTGTDLSYQPGDVAKRDIKAPRDFFVEDKNATQKKKNRTRYAEKFVYDWDSSLKKEIANRVDNSFEIPRKLFTNPQETATPTFERVMKTKKPFEENLGLTVNDGVYRILYNDRFSKETSDKIKTIVSKIMENGVVANKEMLLKEESKGGVILRTIESSEEKELNKLRAFYGMDQAKSMVRIIGDPMLKGENYNLKNLIVDLCQRLIQPNITLNKSETEKRVEAAVSEIKPVLYKIKKGEMIIREGEIVDEVDLVKLNALKKQANKSGTLLTSLGTALITFFSLLVVYLLFLKGHKQLKKNHTKNMLFVASMLVIFLLIAKLSIPIARSASPELPLDLASVTIFMGIPLPAAAITICFFLGFEIALFFSIVLALLTTLIYAGSIEVFIFFFLSCIVGAFLIKGCKERKDFIIGGLKLGVFNIFVAFSLSLYAAAPLDLIFLLKEITLAFCGGLLAGILATGIVPLIEIFFNFTTEIKLMEYSNLEQPLMKRLMIETPGTYNHSVIVATLSEAAANAIGASGLKARVCGYYHDIGKLRQPQYFVENQMDGKNRHDKISPSMSALILIQHVKKGIELARQNKLSDEVMDAIREHHGTSLIKYFYNKSIELKGKDQVKEENFRYPGPKPQTRETGIVMLADVAEAATRALERPTPARIQGRVKELINNIFVDGQLDECELTLKDLHQIAKSFNKILTSIYHSRIEYPDKQKGKKKEKDKDEPSKSADKQPAGKNGAAGGQDKTKEQTDIKRLGI